MKKEICVMCKKEINVHESVEPPIICNNHKGDDMVKFMLEH